MLDFSWAEILVVVAVAALVLGPKEIPAIMRMMGRAVRRVQYLRFAMSQQFEDFMKEHDLQELRGGGHEDELLSPRVESDPEKDSDAEMDAFDDVAPSPAVPAGVREKRNV